MLSLVVNRRTIRDAKNDCGGQHIGHIANSKPGFSNILSGRTYREALNVWVAFGEKNLPPLWGASYHLFANSFSLINYAGFGYVLQIERWLNPDANSGTVPYVGNLNSKRDMDSVLIGGQRANYISTGRYPRPFGESELLTSLLPSSLHFFQGAYRNNDPDDACEKQANIREIFRRKQAREITLRVIGGPIAILWGCILCYRARRWFAGAIGVILLAIGFGAFFLPVYWQSEYQNKQ